METDPLVLSLSKDISSFSHAERRQGLRQAQPERAWVAALGFLIALFFAAPALAQTFPPLTGRVVDQANLLPPEQEAALTQRLEALEQASSRQLVVATIPDLQGHDIADYGNRLFRTWRLGEAQANNGVLLLVAVGERKVRIEVGYGLEGVLTDALSSQIIRNQITPRFRESDYPGGIMAGAEAIIAQLQAPPEAAEQRVLAAQQEESARGSRRGEGGGSILSLIFWGVMLAFMVLPMFGAGFRGRRYRGRRGGGPVSIWGPGVGRGRGDGGLGWMLAGIALSSISRGGGGGSSWGGGGGGGFSGGGGSSGGGGASGGW